MTSRSQVSADHPYEVLIGHRLHDRIPALVGDGVRKTAVLHPPTMVDAAERVVHALSEAGIEPVRIDVPDGEAAKTAQVAARCWSVLGSAGFTRSDAVVGLGGGSTTDLAGFVAATWLRGVRLVTVPTSLLAMVDAAVGGKTGINTPEGKNLVGAFYEPVGVVCDLETLTDLPIAELRSGMAEVVKCGFIADPEILDPGRDRPGDRPRSGRAGAGRAGPTGRPGEGHGGLRRPAGGDLGRHPGGPGGPQLRPHAGARDRAARALPLAARRGDQHRHGVRGRAGPAGRTDRRGPGRAAPQRAVRPCSCRPATGRTRTPTCAP